MAIYFIISNPDHCIILLITGVSNDVDGNNASFPPLKPIWDCDKIKQSVNAKGDASWECLHCNNCKLSVINDTKALLHMLKIGG